MSRPPRIPNWLPWEQSTVYFITFWVAQRKRVLDNDDTWRICRDIFNKLDRWTILAAISMPDHLHFLARRLPIVMLPSPHLRNGSNAGSTTHIGIVGRLCQTARAELGNGKKDVSIACLDRTNLFPKNGNIFARIRFAPGLPKIRMIGHFNSNSIRICRPSL